MQHAADAARAAPARPAARSGSSLPVTSFSDLGLAAPLLRALADEGYDSPTPIQAQAIPAVLEGRDLLGIAQTGTGKTAAFALPILHRLMAQGGRPPRGGCRALILSPTRELASQIADSFKAYGRHLGFSVTTVFGGVAHGPQRRALSAGVDVLVATPGRLLDHLAERTLRLDHVQTFVLDEADQMLDAGFLPAVRKIVTHIPKQRLTLFFSATMPQEIGRLAGELLKEPVKVEVTPVATTAERVAQRVLHVEAGGKRALLASLLKQPEVERVLVFARTKHGADKVVKQLEQDGLAANAIHGNKSQGQRERALAEFKTGRAPILVATDIAARGIDVAGVSHVVQYDLPDTPESYVHRIGRTARAGASGEAVALCAPDEIEKLRAVEKLIRQQIPAEDRRADPSRPIVAVKPAARQKRGGRPAGRAAPHGQPQQAKRPHTGQGQRQGQGQQRAAHAPKPASGGEARRRAPEPRAEGRKDRAWRDADFRDSAPAFLTRGR
jgi:ATP-dependent RNA helicase RhlE